MSADDRCFTYFRIVSDHEYPFVTIGHAIHKADLSDLREPYLSAVKETLSAQNKE